MNSLIRLSRDAVVGASENDTLSKVPGVNSAAALAERFGGRPTAEEKRDFYLRGILATAGGFIGYTLYDGERPLGAVAGVSLGYNILSLLSNDTEDRKQAMADVGTDMAAIAGSMIYKKHPVWGFVFGTLIGGVLAKMIVKKAPIFG